MGRKIGGGKQQGWGQFIGSKEFRVKVDFSKLLGKIAS